jgi:hypothetical protein
MFVCCECCVLSGRGLCDELIIRPEETYRLWYAVVCDLETSRMRRPWLALGCNATRGGGVEISIINVSYVAVFPPYPASHHVPPVWKALTSVQHLQFGIQLCNSLRKPFYIYLLTAAHEKGARGGRGACLLGRRGRLATEGTTRQLWALATCCFITHRSKSQVFRVLRGWKFIVDWEFSSLGTNVCACASITFLAGTFFRAAISIWTFPTFR